MRNKKVIASFKCVLAMLSCLMLGACKPQMAKAAITSVTKVASRGKAFDAAKRFSHGVPMPRISADNLSKSVNPGRMPISQQGWMNVSRGVNYMMQRNRYGESDRENQRSYYR